MTDLVQYACVHKLERDIGGCHNNSSGSVRDSHMCVVRSYRCGRAGLNKQQSASCLDSLHTFDARPHPPQPLHCQQYNDRGWVRGFEMFTIVDVTHMESCPWHPRSMYSNVDQLLHVAKH